MLEPPFPSLMQTWKPWMDKTADQIFRAARMVLGLLVGRFSMLQEVCTCCYLFHCLLRPHFPLVESLCSQVIDTMDEYFSLFVI